MSEIKVNKISPKQTCTQLTLGDSGDTIIIPAGATITNNGTATGFGATGAVNWDTTPKTTTVTAVSGVGYFVDTTTTTLTVNLPVGTAGSIVAVSDYANTAATNKITIDPNGTDKINGINQNAEITTNGASITLIYVDSTRGWKDVNDATLNVTGINPFVAATGGTITTCGNYKIHTFTGPGTFTVTNAGNPSGSTTVDYLVVAGGGGGAGGNGNNCGRGGGGAGGFRFYASPNIATPYPASPLNGPAALPVSVTGYPITVGAGGSGGGPGNPSPGTTSGNNSIFSTITSTGGGKGSEENGGTASPGGSGGGAAQTGSIGTGNTPPTSPSQGNNGGQATFPGSPYAAGGGGGALAVGQSPGNNGGNGGVGGGLPSAFGTSGQPSGGFYYYSGGGGAGRAYSPSVAGTGGLGGGANGGCSPTGGAGNSGTSNTGGGGGTAGQLSGGIAAAGGSGGSGIVVIRYKFQ
jgi:hypothetical protein